MLQGLTHGATCGPCHSRQEGHVNVRVENRQGIGWGACLWWDRPRCKPNPCSQAAGYGVQHEASTVRLTAAPKSPFKYYGYVQSVIARLPVWACDEGKKQRQLPSPQ